MKASDPPDRGTPIVLAVEQALSMSYATLRFAQLGWRVIRVEPTPIPGRQAKGDPNRSIGRPVSGDDIHSYFVGPNVGKEAIALNLKTPEGQGVLRRLIRELPVDVFCTNTLPAHHETLGLDYASLSAERPELIWASISAMGLAHPDVPGYDPVLQALCGYMDITGAADGPPTQNGPPLTDLKAGDEVFAQVLLALWERERSQGQSGQTGRVIDVSMAQVATSWLLTFLPMLDMGSDPSELRRSGNEHRQFIPTNAYPTADGFIYMAVGSDAQWSRLVAHPVFAPLDEPVFATNEGRRGDKGRLHDAIASITRGKSTEEVDEALSAAGIPHAPITPIEKVMDLPMIRPELLRTEAPDGRSIRLPPAGITTDHLKENGRRMPFPPSYGQHTRAVLQEAGVPEAQITTMYERGDIA